MMGILSLRDPAILAGPPRGDANRLRPDGGFPLNRLLPRFLGRSPKEIVVKSGVDPVFETAL